MQTIRDPVRSNIYSCLGKIFCPCPLLGNSDDEIKDNVANMVGQGWENSKDVRVKYGQKRTEARREAASTRGEYSASISFTYVADLLRGLKAAEKKGNIERRFKEPLEGVKDISF